MSLRKPSDLFDNESQKENDIPLVEVSEDNFNKVFDVLNTYQSYLSDFEEKLKSITSLSEQVNNLQKELENSIKKEDLDKAVLSQFLYINESISNLGDNVKLVGKTVNTTISEGSEQKKLKKPSDLFVEEKSEVCIPLVEVSEETFNDVFGVFNSYQSYLNNFEDKLNCVNNLVEQISFLKSDIESALKKEDLDKAILSQLLYVNESISNIENNVRVINEDKLDEIREDANFLLSKVEKFIEFDVPKYKKNLIDFEIRVDNKVDHLIDKNISPIKEEVNQKLIDISHKTDSIEVLKDDILETIQNIEVSADEHSKQNNKRIQHIEDYLKKSSLGTFKRNIFEKVVRIETEVTINENRLKIQNKQLEKVEKEIYEAIQDLKVSDLVEDNKKLQDKINDLENLYEEIKNKKPEVIIEQTSFDFPESLKSDDPLTPLDEKYVTLEQLQQHYRLFINRIQQQLSSLGGGGETRLKYLDDIVGIATNPSIYDGKYLKYNHSSRDFEFASSWTDGIDGPYTMSKVGIGTTSIRYSPYYTGADNPDNVAQHNLALLVIGDARITGILTIGQGSITLDADSGKIASGETELLNPSGGAYYKGDVTVGGLYAGIYTGSNVSIRCDDILEGTIKSPPSLVIDPSPDGSEGDFVSSASTIGNVSIAGTDRITGIYTGSIQIGQHIDEVSGVISYGTKVSGIGQSYAIIDNVSIGSTTNHVFRFGSRLPSSGTVTIKGDLIVEGKETKIESQTLEISDKTIGIASASTPLSDQQLDGAGIIIHGSDSNKSLVWDNSNSRLGFNTSIYSPKYYGDGYNLENVRVTTKNSNSTLGLSNIIDFSTNLTATISGDVTTVSANIALGDLSNVDVSNLNSNSTDYLLIYDPSIPGFKFVNPKTYFGINNDFNSDPDIDDFGSFE